MAERGSKRKERAACASIRGYRYQCCLGVERWMELQDDEGIIFEGDEDLDRFLLNGNQYVCEQIKDLSKPVSVRSEGVSKSLQNFMVTYCEVRQNYEVQQNGAKRRFIFTTTTRRRRQELDEVLDIDLLAVWAQLEEQPQEQPRVIAALRRLAGSWVRDSVAGRRRTPEGFDKAATWFENEPDRWDDFVNAVKWNFGAPNITNLEKRIAGRLLERYPQTATILPELLVQYLVAKVLEISSQSERHARARTRTDLDRVFDSIEAKFTAWRETPQASALQKVFDECARLDRILYDGVYELEPDQRLLSHAALLTAGYEVIPFDKEGRQDQLEALEAWCHSDAPRGVWLFLGKAGTGKTRLLIEWCKRLRHQAWHAGFVVDESKDLEPLFEGDTPRLAVVDYAAAETKRKMVIGLLKRLARHQGPKLRIVLLARHEPSWWDGLRKGNTPVAMLTASPEPWDLPPVFENRVLRANAFHQAIRVFARELHVEPPAYVPDVDFTLPHFERALYLHVAALAALHDEPIQDAGDLLHTILAREIRLWNEEIDRDGGLDELKQHRLKQCMSIAIAALTLVDGVGSETEAAQLFAHLLDGDSGHLDISGYLAMLSRRFYGTPNGIKGLQPDLLGEQLIQDVRIHHGPLLQKVYAWTSDAVTRLRLVTVLDRVIQRNSNVSEWVPPQRIERNVRFTRWDREQKLEQGLIWLPLRSEASPPSDKEADS